MAEVASAFVSLMPSAKGFGRSSERQISPQMNSVAKKTGSRFGKVFAYSSMSPLKAIGAAAVGLFAVKAVKDFFQGAIGEAREAQKVTAITANVIKTTGAAANISATQVARLTTAISNKTGIDDEAIQSGANLLLTFTNIRNEVGAGNDIFNQATQSITDLGAAMGKDPKAAAVQLGKALNDPVKGITALTRVGVAFTDQQKSQIETLVASGKTVEAQKIILKELRKEFGGTAEAAATSGEKLKVAFDNLKETVGTALLPYLDRAENAIAHFITTMNTPANLTKFKDAIVPIADAFRTISSVVGSFVTDHLQPFLVLLSGLGGAALSSFAFLVGSTLVSALGVLAGALLSPVALIGAVVGAAIYAYLHFATFKSTVDGLAASFMTNVMPALQQFGAYLLSTVVPAVVAFAQQFVTTVLPALQRFGAYLTSTVIPKVSELAQKVGTNLKPVWDQLAATFTGSVLPALQRLGKTLQENWPQIQRIIEAITRWIGKGIELYSLFVSKVAPVMLKFAGVLIETVIPGVVRVISVFIKIIGTLVAFGSAVAGAVAAVVNFAKKVVEKIGDVITTIKGLPDKAKAALGNLGSLLYSAGQDLMRGFINGVKSMASELAGAAKDAAQGAVDGVKGLLHIGSPSKVFDQIGRWTMEGFANGIKGASVKVLKEMQDAVQKTLEKVDKLRDGVASRLDSLKSAFSSLKDSIASTFTGDLFDASAVEAVVPEMVKPEQFDKWSAQTQQNWLDQAALLQQKLTTPAKTASQVFTENLLGVKGNLKNLVGAFKKLVKWGLSPGFLSQLFSSGNGGLILELAAGSKATALQDSNLFGQVQSLSNQLGGQVARNQYGAQIDGLRQELKGIKENTRELKHLAKDIGRELNQAAAAARRDKSRGGAAA